MKPYRCCLETENGFQHPRKYDDWLGFAPLSKYAARYIRVRMGISRRSIFRHSLLSSSGVRTGGGGRLVSPPKSMTSTSPLPTSTFSDMDVPPFSMLAESWSDIVGGRAVRYASESWGSGGPKQVPSIAADAFYLVLITANRAAAMAKYQLQYANMVGKWRV